MKSFIKTNTMLKDIKIPPGDVTKMPVIGTVKVKGLFGAPSELLEVVAIIENPDKSKTYVINKWYKEWKKIPQLVPEILVHKYTSKNWRDNL